MRSPRAGMRFTSSPTPRKCARRFACTCGRRIGGGARRSTDAGSVTVHWTDPVDRSQSYIPMASPFVSKLAAIAARAHSAHPFDVIYSHYLEPYGVAGYLAAQMTGVPHVVRMAGSDAGRLWQHPQLEALYDHVLRSAEVVIATGAVADRAVAARRRSRPHRVWRRVCLARRSLHAGWADAGPCSIAEASSSRMPSYATSLWGDFAMDRPHFGIYGKLGDNKGSFALLPRMQRLKLADTNVGLVALAHGRPEVETRFRERAARARPDRPRAANSVSSALAGAGIFAQLPRRLLSRAGFPHRAFTARSSPLEVLLCGTCLVGSTEVMRKLPQWERLPHDYSCVAVEDVNDVDRLAAQLSAIARHHEEAAGIAARGHRFRS